MQLAARKVAEENKRLRDILKENGVGEEYISQYLQRRPQPSNSIPLASLEASATVQSMHQAMAPRRLASVESSSPFMLPNQTIPSTSPVSTATMSTGGPWDGVSSDASSTYGQQQDSQMGNQNIPVTEHLYQSSMFVTGAIAPGGGVYTTQPPVAYSQTVQRSYSGAPMQHSSQAVAGYNDPAAIYSPQHASNYNHPPGYLG